MNTTRMAERIEVWAVETLIPYDKNPRTHSAEQISQIAASIAQFGFLNPILVDTAAGIIAGHGRLQAAKQLGLAQVPVVVLDHLTETQKRAYVIADNKLALNAGWDDDLLRDEMNALAEEDFDLDLLGFDATELDEILFSDEEDTSDEDDAVPETPVEPISKTGDLWRLGDHYVLCGDATILTDIEKVMQGQLADMVFTDPPYNVDYANTTKEKIRGKARPILNDNLGENFGQFLYDSIVNMLAVTKGALYICMSTRELPTLHTAFENAGGKWSDYLVSLGGLPDDVQKRLHELRGSVPTILNPKRKCLPPPGTNLVREYQGITHRVTVLYEGFEYEGRKYDNLSIIARLITGTRWSGPLFFGLKS